MGKNAYFIIPNLKLLFQNCSRWHERRIYATAQPPRVFDDADFVPKAIF